jgi:hypothetical protein
MDQGKDTMHRYCSDVVIHIDEELPDDDIYELERDLGAVPGVYSACVNDRARHLLLVDYDPEGVHAADLLNMVRQHGVGAELIGL